MQKMISPKELAEFLGMPLQTIYEWNYAGTGPKYRRFGKHVRYAAEDIAAWLESRRVERGDRTGTA
ncbi:helix-turn-helix domain-containing protein [Streptomyces violaceus]|uniref:helix-turn-helix transcriptional regulator n=1 Tax=Streptomyces violaceus TaxID=1936 RepID=UPI002E21B207